MATVQLDTLVRHIKGLATGQALRQRTDRQLLDDFSARRDQSAFAALLSRHGPMVLRVCRRVLRHEQDAEDAFQATFLVLARQTASIRKHEALASWLYGVAYRTAMKAKRGAARRRNHEAKLRDRAPSAAPSPTWCDVQAVLDEEIRRLPESFRSAFVACVLEGEAVSAAAAAQGVKECTLSWRLARARRQLRQRLARRGIELAAVLAALSLARGAADAAVPAALARVTIGFGLSVAAGEPAAAIPSHIAALAAGVRRAMFVSKAKIATLLVVAAGLFVAGAGALTRENVAAKEAPPATRQGAESQPAKEKDAATYAGRVLDPEGKPVAGAKLYLLYYTPKALPVPVRATSGEDGRFRFTVAHADLDTSYANEPWKGATVVAAAAGFGLAAPDAGTGAASNPSDLTLRLVKDDVPLTGRVLDLQGKSIAGVRLSVQGLHWSREGDLTPFLQDLKEKKVYFPALRQRLAGFEGTWIGRDAGTLFPAVTTDAEGRFRINGVGRERLVELCLEAPTVATRNLSVTTRPGPAISVGGLWKAGDADGAMIVHGTGADHVVAPCKPVVGVVRDKDTGKPIPGAVVTGSQRAGGRTAYQTEPRAVADHEGRYVLTGLPKGDGNVLRAVPPEGQPYLITLHRVGDSPGLDPITVDIALKRGVWINGKVIDKATGRPVPAHVEYAVFADNPNRTEVPDLSVDNDTQTRPDGTFRLVGLPGRGLIGARGHDDRYRMAVGADKIKGADGNGLFQTYPHILVAGNFHTLVEVNPAKGADALECEVALDPGRALTGTVLDPEGKPLAGALASGLTATGTWELKPLKGAEFTVAGLEKGRPRVLQFVHKGKGLAGFLVVKGDEEKPLSVRLEPSGSLTGRLVTPEGAPVTDGELLGMQETETTLGNLPRDVRPGKDGKFRIEGLAPGLAYKLNLYRGVYLHTLGGAAADKVTVKAGETKDLGDIEVKPIE